MAIILGLAAAVSYGVADFIAREASHREGTLKALLYLQVVGTPTGALLAFASERVPWEVVFSPTGLASALISLEFTLSGFLLYRALAAGPLLIVSPIASSFAAVTVVLSLLSGERPTMLQGVGMAITLVGVVLAAIAPGDSAHEAQSLKDSRRVAGVPVGIVLAIGAAVLIGVGSWLVRFVIPLLGSGTTVLVMRSTSLIYVLIFFAAGRRSLGLRSAASLKWLLPIGVLDTAANWFYNQGLMLGLTAIVAVIASLFSIVTVLSGYFILKERVTRVQQAGILITLVGVALVSV